MKELFARRAVAFSTGSQPYGTGELWHLRYGDGEGDPYIHFSVGPNFGDADGLDEEALGWHPGGLVELYGFKSGDYWRSVREMAWLASEAAERLGGVIMLEKDFEYATADEYRQLASEPGFLIP
ncbi:MAG: hypothetical protein AAF170_19135 [Bacteroidota bacterium]